MTTTNKVIIDSAMMTPRVLNATIAGIDFDQAAIEILDATLRNTSTDNDTLYRTVIKTTLVPGLKITLQPPISLTNPQDARVCLRKDDKGLCDYSELLSSYVRKFAVHQLAHKISVQMTGSDISALWGSDTETRARELQQSAQAETEPFNSLNMATDPAVQLLALIVADETFGKNRDAINDLLLISGIDVMGGSDGKTILNKPSLSSGSGFGQSLFLSPLTQSDCAGMLQQATGTGQEPLATANFLCGSIPTTNSEWREVMYTLCFP